MLHPQAHLLKFFVALRDNGPPLTDVERAALSRYVSFFNSWGEEARVERYGQLHYIFTDAQSAGSNVRAAVLAHIEEAAPAMC